MSINITAECLNQTTLELDLMTLTGKVSQTLIDKRSIPAQQYNWIRLKLDELGDPLLLSAEN